MTIYIVEPPEGKVYQADSLQEHMRQEASNLIKECKKHESMPHRRRETGLCWCTNDLCPHIYPHRVLKTRKENNDVTLCNTWKEVKKIMHDEGMYQCRKCNEWMAEVYIDRHISLTRHYDQLEQYLENTPICSDCNHGVNNNYEW